MDSVRRWHHTRLGLLIFGFIELGLTYLAFTHAENSGSLWAYILVIILLVGGIQNLVRLGKRLVS